MFQVGGVGSLPETRRRVVADQDHADGYTQRENDGGDDSGHLHAGSQGRPSGCASSWKCFPLSERISPTSVSRRRR